MIRLGLAGAAAAIMAAAGAILIGGGGLPSRPLVTRLVSTAAAADAGTPIYFQDPDGRPVYSPTPKKTPDGRDWRAVPASADVSFDEPQEPPAETRNAEARTQRKIRYYRNPMGLPDTSPVPKKDSMGMDYIAVYEGEDSDDGSVKLSPGRIQRTGAKSEPVVRQPIKSSRCASRGSSKASPTSRPAITSTRGSRL
jgi:membrane fusion protein, copper/silver efflux system